MPTTTTDLVKELKGLPGKPSSMLLTVIRRAEEGVYHDFLTEIATPKVTLYRDLLALGFTSMARRVVNGEWDEKPGEK